MIFFNFDRVVQRIFRYLIKRYLGNYLTDFAPDEVSYQLSHGSGSVENVLLNVDTLNDLSEEYNLPFEFLHGSIDLVSIYIPWRKLLIENTIIEVKGLKLVVQPKERPQDASMFDSMWGSMASSLQLAEECIKSNENDDEMMGEIPNRSEGLEKIAKTIDTVLENTKVKFSDTSFKIEQILPNEPTGISLEIKIAKAEYFDEAGSNTLNTGNKSEDDKSSNEPSAYSFKRVVFEGISLFTSEFLPEERSAFSQQLFPENVQSTAFVPGSPEMPPTHPSLPVKKIEQSCNREPVLISRLSGSQVLRLKLKQNEAVIGPKVDVIFNFGAFNLYLTPQQVHLLLSLIKGLLKPCDTICDTSKKGQPSSVANKPMRPADYALVEQELLRQQERSDVTPRSLKNLQGWSSHSLDESDDDFHLMTMENKGTYDVPPSTSAQEELLSNSMNSDIRSEASSFTCNPKVRHRGSSVQDILTNSSSELTHFHGSFSSLLIIILHDDSVQETFTGEAQSSSGSLKDKSEAFFQDLLDLQLNGFNFKDFSSSRQPLSKLCSANHLRLMATGIVLDGNETSTSAERSLKFNLSFNQFEILECLFNSSTVSKEAQNPKYMKLVTFPKNESSLDSKEACLKLKYSKVECTSQIQRSKPPANKLDIHFGTMICDIDISLTDRIRTLLNFSNAVDNSGSKWNHWKDSEIGLVSCQSSSKTEISVSSTNVTINLWFPVPDLRSVHDINRAPWWQQNIHKEVLIFILQEITLKTTLDADETIEKYEIQAQDIHGLFKIPSSEEPISFLRVAVDPDSDEVSRNNGFDWPRLEVRRNTKVASTDLENGLEEVDEPYSCSLSYAMMTNLASDLSPFCSTSVIHEKVEKERNSNLTADPDEIIKPSDKETMCNFMEHITNKSEYVFEFTLPTVNIVLPDKDFFELLYNRLASDLALWSNTSFNSTNAYESGGFKVHVPGLDVSYHKNPNDLYPIFKPFANDSNSSSDEEETLYMSVHEYYQQQKHKHQKASNPSMTKFSFSFSITRGSLLINSPIMEENPEIIPTHCGKLQLHVEDAVIFFATYYKGDPNESYICLYADRSALYHDSLAPIESKYSVVEPVNSAVQNNLKKIIYASDPEMHLKSAVNFDNMKREMLKFSVHIVKSPKQQIKTFKIAIEIARATLRHYIVPSPQMWINQLIDFLKVKDFPVNGYNPPAVVTELHLNLSNCAVDYRPLNLPYRTALAVENFNMSCNMTAATPSFLFRIISEELRMFISTEIECKKIDLRKNYVCVFDSGLIDISIRTGVDEKHNPKFEMSITNNKVHIRTCSDSFRALLELIEYLSSSGDMELEPSDEKENESEKSSFSSKTDISDPENLDQLMAEAMKECCRIPNDEDKARKSKSDFEYSSTDDEFCILEDDPGAGIKPRNGEPQIRILTDEPIRIIENHFSVPPGKSDILKAPKHFPNPLFLLTLQAQSLVWNFYGGNDFKKKGSSKKGGVDSKSDMTSKNNHTVTFSDQENLDNATVSFCKVTPVSQNYDSGFVQFSMEHVTIKESKKYFTPDSWIHKGGPGRNHDVLLELQLQKVQFQKEVYPFDSEQASRILLYIYDIVIKDKLANSKINKFLYQFSSQEQPKQSNANMFDLKAVFTRPDPKSTAEECTLRVSCQPIRLNIDQDTMTFIFGFFLKAFDVPVPDDNEGESKLSKEGSLHPKSKLVPNSSRYQNKSPDSETFYKCFSFSQDLKIRIDYQSKNVQLEQGAFKGILLGLMNLDSAEITLKRLCYRHGLLGHKKLISYALNEWQQDIMKNQLPSLISGVGPMHSLVQLVQGVKDLFYMPVVQYRRDGQIVRGLQKGATSFSKSTIAAALDLTSKFIYLLQETAQISFDIVSPSLTIHCKRGYQGSEEEHHKNHQPADIIEGVTAAYQVLKKGLEEQARTMYRVASTEHEHKGVPGAVGGVIRQLPPAIIQPFILTSKATTYVLDGAKHQLMPDAHQEDIHKWKTKSN